MAQESAFSYFADKPLPCGQKPFQGVVLRRVFSVRLISLVTCTLQL